MSPDRAKQLVEAGLWLRLSGDSEGASRLFEQALKVDPENPKARLYLERIHHGETPLSLDKPAELSPVAPRPNPFVRKDSGTVQPLPTLEGDWGLWADNPAAGSALPSPIRLENPLPLPLTEPLPSSSDFEPFDTGATNAWDFQPDNVSVALPSPEHPEKDALDWVADLPPAEAHVEPPRRTDELDSLVRGAEDLLGLDDHSGAMDLLMRAQNLAPHDEKVQQLLDSSQRVLLNMLESKLGDMQRVPRVQLKDDDIIWLNLDHRAGFVLAQIDGSVTYDDLFALSGMTRIDTARILAQLLDEGVIVGS